MMTFSKILHVYGQDAPHSEVFIVGDRASLAHLKQLIESVLETGNPDKKELSVNDGEGFDVIVALHEDQDGQLAAPYHDEIYAERRDTAIRPWNLPGVLEVVRRRD